MNGKIFAITFVVGMLLVVLIYSISSYAFATLSIHPVDLIDYETHLKTRVWWLTVSQNQMSDYAYGSISSNNIKDPDSGATASKDLEIRMKVDQETCSYTIALGEPIYRWDYKKIYLNYFLGECNEETGRTKCISNYPNTKYIVVAKAPYSFDCYAYCFIPIKVGYFGDISTPYLTFKSTITLKSGNEQYSATIDRMDQTEVNFPNDIAYARWTGSLTSGDECPKAKEEDVGAVWLYKDGKWHFIDYSNYLTYKAKSDNIFNCINGVDSDDEASLCVNEVNSALDTALLPKTFKSRGGSTAEAYGSLDRGKVVINLNKLIQYPVINMYVKADWLGVVMPYGMPKIINAYSTPFDPSKGNGYIIVTVQNVGKAEGSFAVTAQCDYPFSIKSTEYTPTLKPGDTATVNLVLTAPTSTTKYKGTCKVIVYDRAHTINRDSTTVSVETKTLPKGCEDYGYKSFPPACPKGYQPKTVEINGLTCYTGECEKVWTPVPKPSISFDLLLIIGIVILILIIIFLIKK